MTVPGLMERLTRERSRIAFEAGFLLAIVAAMTWFEYSAHWTSIWGDRGFSGWVSGTARLMGMGQQLYTDGGHLPLPPLSYALVYVVSGGE